MTKSRDPLRALDAPAGAVADGTPDQVESRPELDGHLTGGSLAGLTLHGLRLDVDPPDLAAVDVRDTLFVGCHFASVAVQVDLVNRGAQVIAPFLGLPYPTHPARLYTPDDLAEGFAEGGFDGMYDTVVFHHFLRQGGAVPPVREALAQRLHDAGIDAALGTAVDGWVRTHGSGAAVGIMGGHAEPRGSTAYRLAATLAHQLAGRGRLVVTGGGPGVMEAANLGAYLHVRPLAELTGAIDRLAAAPDFHRADPYTAVALAVRAAFPAGDIDGPGALARGGLAVPTWLYGHEPVNLFAARIGKYFSNAVREDMILRLARGGIVFAPGRAGTVQEVFQAATKTFYATDGESGPFVFLGRDYWRRLPVADLLRRLLAGSPHGDQSPLVLVTDAVDEAVAVLTG